MSEDLVGLVETMAEEVGVDLRELFAGFVAVEEAEDPPFGLATSLVHGHGVSLLWHHHVGFCLELLNFEFLYSGLAGI